MDLNPIDRQPGQSMERNRRNWQRLRLLFDQIIQVIGGAITPVKVALLSYLAYDTGSHKLQSKTRNVTVLASEAETAASDVLTASLATVITAWRYDATTHKFQVKTQSIYAVEAAAASGWTDVADGSQPSSLATAVRDVNYNTTTHVLSQDYTASVYVLEKGSDTSAETIDTAETCT